MIKSDPIIAVKNVEASSQWYQRVFDCKSIHGGDEFAVLEDENGEVIICLHKWGEHEHPTMINQSILQMCIMFQFKLVAVRLWDLRPLQQ